jgi:hypothetical protein
MKPDPSVPHSRLATVTVTRPPDRETGIGKSTEAQIVTALPYGTRPDGTIIGAPIPVATYHDMSDDDLAAIAKYLHTMKSIRHAVDRTLGRGPWVAPETRADASAYFLARLSE